MLAYRIATRLTTDSIAGLVTAAFFALLAVHAEAVIWATAFPESLAGTFQLGAFCLYLRYRDRELTGSLAWSLVFFAGALLSHESAITFPILIAAHALIWPPQADATPPQGLAPAVPWRQRVRVALAKATPFIAIAIVYLAMRFAALGFIARREVNNQATMAQNIFTVPTVIAHNLAVIINPWQAGPSHRIVWVSTPWSCDFWMPALGLILIALAGVTALIDSPKRKLYVFAAAWVLIAMAPMLNLGILYPNALVADWYMYFSSFGWCLMAGQAVVAVARSNPASARLAGALVAIALMVCAITV